MVRKRYFVTGASGFIGRALCQQLYQQGHVVHVLLRREQPGPWHEAFIGDLLSGALPSSALRGVDAVFHLAGGACPAHWPGDEESFYQRLHVTGTRRLLEAALTEKVRAFIYFSSVMAMGERESFIMDESYPPHPATPYGRAKLAAERLLLDRADMPHLCILRPCLVYGPGNIGDLGGMVQKIARGLYPPLPEVGNKRSFIHVDDVVQAAQRAADHPKAHRQVFILTDGQPCSSRELYDWIRQALGKPARSWSLPWPLVKGLARMGDAIGRLCGRRFKFDSNTLSWMTFSHGFSHAKIRDRLGVFPKRTMNVAFIDAVRSVVK